MITAKENYWRIDEWHDMPWGKAPALHVIGHARQDDDKILFPNPVPSTDITRIANHGKPARDQVWEREPVPEYWTQPYLDAIAEERFKVKVGNKYEVNYNWWRNDDNLSDEQFQYKDREWNRRMFGHEIFIGGNYVYLTGPHYTYLQHWWLDGKAPEFRERDLLWFYTWQAVVNDPLCYGKIEPKHRRAGDTSKAAFVGWEIASRTIGGHFGIQATGEGQAGKVFSDKIVPGWKRLIPFFKPISPSGSNPVGGIIMDVESRRGKSKHFHMDGEEGLEAWIKFAPRGKEGVVPFDGDKLHCFLRDEGGKAKDEDIEQTLDIIKPCMLVDGLPAKMLWPSTVEDITGDNQGRYHSIVKDSMPSLALTTGTASTISGMKAVFIPCYCGHSDIFIGKFGQSIVHKPSPDDLEWLLDNRAKTPEHRRVLADIYAQGGAYEFEVRERSKQKNLIDYCRRFPFTMEEVFAPSNPNSDFNIENCGRTLMELMEPSASGFNLIHDLTETGNFEWVDQQKGLVKWVPTPRGRFIVNKEYMPGTETARQLGIIPNDIVRGEPRQDTNEAHGVCRPGSESWIKIGTDPQKTAAVDRKEGKRYSQAAAHGFYPYHQLREGVEWTAQSEADPEFSRDWKTHAFIFEYILHPKDPRQHHEDMLKACFFFNARILFERQLNEMGHWFRRIGCGAFLITDKEWIKNKDNAVPGVHSSPDIIELYKHRIKIFTDHHCWARRIPFPRTLTQWIEFKLEDIEKFDGVVGSGLALLAAQPGPIRKEQKKTDIAPEAGKRQLGIENLITLHR